MIPKAMYTQARSYVRVLTKAYQAETVGKTGLASVPIEVGRMVVSFILPLGVSETDAYDCCEYMAKQGLLSQHPWGGYMVPLSKDAPIPPEPPKDLDEVAKVANEIFEQKKALLEE